MRRLTRRSLLRWTGGAGFLGLAGCVGDSGDPQTPDSGGTSTARTTVSKSVGSTNDVSPPIRERGLPNMYDFDELRRNIRSGGPPKDGIPSIDEPKFIDAQAGDQILDPGDVVFGVTGETERKAYPQSIMVWHEIVNDTLDGLPVSVTYCPLTGTVIGFERGETTFGTSGDLLNNNLVMYDRATDSRWPQILGTAVTEPMEGQSLREFRLVWTTWRQWKTLHPDTTVLSEETGYVRDYNRDPYGQYNPKGGYYTSDTTLFPVLHSDDRYHLKEIVMGTRVPTGVVAFLKESLSDAGVVNGRLGDSTYTAVYDRRLDTAYVYHNPDGLSISYDGNDVTLGGDRYDPNALPLERALAFDAMWFAWSGFYPSTEVYP